MHENSVLKSPILYILLISKEEISVKIRLFLVTVYYYAAIFAYIKKLLQ